MMKKYRVTFFLKPYTVFVEAEDGLNFSEIELKAAQEEYLPLEAGDASRIGEVQVIEVIKTQQNNLQDRHVIRNLQEGNENAY